jgi:hypothetical protein
MHARAEQIQRAEQIWRAKKKKEQLRVLRSEWFCWATQAAQGFNDSPISQTVHPIYVYCVSDLLDPENLTQLLSASD